MEPMLKALEEPTSELHATTRVQHEPLRRTITILSARNLTPRMRRFVFAGESLKTFKSLGFDDHIKVFFPATGASGESTTVARDFTPRNFDAVSGQLTVDFALHDAGPATTWVCQAKPGDTLEIGGPRGSLIIPDDFDWYLMIGDETALPAIGRRLEHLRPTVPAATIIVVSSDQEQQRLRTVAAWTPIWLYRDGAHESDEKAIRNALDKTILPSGDGHIWLAGESTMVRSIRSYLIDIRRHPAEWLRAAGYWKRGLPGAHEKF